MGGQSQVVLPGDDVHLIQGIQQIALLDGVINKLEQTLIQYAQHPLFAESQTRLEENLSNFNKNILHNKETQFWRDKHAFSEGYAYRWKNYVSLPNNHSRREPKNKNNTQISKLRRSSDPEPERKNSSQRNQARSKSQQKRDRSFRNSPEHDSKKCAMDTASTQSESQDTQSGRMVTKEYTAEEGRTTSPELNSNIPLTQEPPKQLTSSAGSNKVAPQKALNSSRGPASPQTNKTGKGLDPFVARIQQTT